MLQRLKESLEQMLRVKLAFFQTTIGPKLSIWAKRRPFVKLHFCDLYLSIAPYNAAKVEKKSLQWILSYKLA